jgi:hypothetical protein
MIHVTISGLGAYLFGHSRRIKHLQRWEESLSDADGQG